MPGNISDRMNHWTQVKQELSGIPVRRVWEIFNKMLIDREKFIFGRSYPAGGYGFLYRTGSAKFSGFLATLIGYMDIYYAVYPPYPAQSGLPVLDSYAKILQYGSAKYPDLHDPQLMWGKNYIGIEDYVPEQCYKTAAAGGDDDYAFLNQYQLFEKLWNLIHYFGGVCLMNNDRTYGIPYWETGGMSYSYGGSYYSSRDYPSSTGLRFFYTPNDDRQYKYICLGTGVSEEDDNGLTQYRNGENVLYESDWMSGAFVSPWLKENSFETYVGINRIRMNVYPRFPDFYDPETLEPVYF